jgi:amino acid adenylation domain-containing protein
VAGEHDLARSDRSSDPMERGRVALESATLEPMLTDRLSALAARESASPVILAVAVLAAVHHRCTDESDLELGVEVSGAGPSLQVRLALTEATTFAELLAQVKKVIEPGLREDAPAAAPNPDAATVRCQRVRLSLRTEADAWGLSLEQLEPADGGEAERALAHVETVLEAVAADGGQRVSELPLLGVGERQRLLEEWNGTAGPYPAACVHELIAEHAERHPDQVAVQFDGKRLTYGELDGRANRLAQYLRGLGVGPDVLVGVCLERSLDLLVGLLGVLKAGGAYVPIDPGYPVARQSYMLSQSGAPVILTQQRLVDGLPDGDARVVCLDGDWPSIEKLPARPPVLDASPEQLAYVIYTSGSTGDPKGVEIPHRALMNFLWAMRERPGLCAEDVLVAVTTLSFDIAGLELYLPLITGARVVIAPTATAADPRLLAELLESVEATALQATPTTWRMLVDAGWSGRRGLKALCGGEAMPAGLADELLGRGVELWNMYGPTETTIWSTVSRVAERGATPTIGRPIANTSLYILDSRLEPVPVGVVGELHIGGDGLARGYRGRPDLTAERFIVHPFDGATGARVYRTGDLARYRPNGDVDFLGRVDHQVKVRGYRIELGEIETALTRHPGVRSAVVVPRHEGAVAELAAYVIPAGPPITAAELRRHVGQTLPGYMVPSTVTTLDAFPLTPNGKVDRKALPEPARERSDEHEFVAPRTDLERRLARIWERVLDIHPIGVSDNFFDLGVTSIVAATLFAHIERELGGELPLGALFSAPTIESLARLLEDGSSGPRWSSLVPMRTGGSRPPIFCVHGGAGTILHIESLARELGDDQPFYALQSRGLYRRDVPLTTVEDMAAHYLEELRTVQPHGPYYLAGYCFGTLVAFEMAHRLVSAGEEVAMVAMFNGPSPAWIRRWNWYGAQPSQRDRFEHLRVKHPVKRRLLKLFRDPRLLVPAVVGRYHTARRNLRNRVARWSVAHGRPISERARESYFLYIHMLAERAYEPEPYPGDLLIFYGNGLYEDPTLGWDGLAERGIESHAVPGEHTDNRQAMHEPHVQFVRDRLLEYLARDREPRQPAAASVPAADGAFAGAVSDL